MNNSSKLPFVVIAVFAAVVFGATSSPAQDDTTLQKVSPKVIEKVDTGDAPIQIEKRIGWGRSGSIVTRVKLTDENAVQYSLCYPSDKLVKAYSLILNNGRENTVRMYMSPNVAIVSPTGSFDVFTLSTDDDPTWTFDWILFADGSTWGPDRHGRSVEILNFLKGRETAVKRAVELLGYSETNPIVRTLRTETRKWWAMNLPRRESDVRGEREYFLEGYDSIVEHLVRDADHGKRELSQQIAERLKEIEKL